MWSHRPGDRRPQHFAREGNLHRDRAASPKTGLPKRTLASVWSASESVTLHIMADAARFGNYGTPDPQLGANLYTQRLDELYARCKFEYEPIATAFPTFIMNHFANNSVYDAFNGTDYTPHNLQNYPEHSHWRRGLRPRPTGSKPIVGGLCDIESSSKGGLQYTIMRVGPFTSNGGYDWWQYAGHDVNKLSRHLTGGRTIGINSHWVAGVEVETGKTLGYPPMHVHHIHLVPAKPWLRYQWATPATAGWRNVLHHLTEEQGAAYYVPNYVMEQHGEWDLCDIHTSKTGCFAEELPSGYTNLIDFPLDFEGELNDGRRVGAPDLNFWLEIGLGWTYDVTSRKPLSYAVITEDHFGMVDGHQHTYENYHWVPSTGEWVNYYTGRMPTSGNLVRMKHHVHMNLMYRAYFIATSADELELSARPIGPDGEEMGAKEVPGAFFSHGGTLGKLLFDSTETDARLNTWPVGVVAVDRFGHPDLVSFEKALLARARSLPGGETNIKCSLTHGSLEVDGFLWDRAGRSDCKSWRFEKGASFTSVSLLKYHGGKVGPWSPDSTPPRLPSHNQWNMYFESDDDASHYFLYSALIHDPHQKIRRYVLRELLLMMNWRIVNSPHAPMSSRLVAASMSVRRLAPVTLAMLALCLILLARLALVKKNKKKD